MKKNDFYKLVLDIKSSSFYTEAVGFGICKIDRGQKNKKNILQATFLSVNWNENSEISAIFQKVLFEDMKLKKTDDSEFTREINSKFIEKTLKYTQSILNDDNIKALKLLKEKLTSELYKVVFIFKDVPPSSVEAVYLKLYAISLQKAFPRSLNLNGAFGILKNVAWSGNKPYELEWLRENRAKLIVEEKYPKIDFVDKFPRFLQHIIPSDNTRILDSSKVRFGAYISNGTTLMPGASYVNFNAGTLGPSMVEGRISSSAIVGKGTDIGGGASILGVLSGTSGNPISIGENCLLGANSITGIPLGDSCIVDAGIAVLEGTKFYMSKEEFDKIKKINPNWNTPYKPIFKGIELSSLKGLHFRQDSTTGQMKVFRSKKEIKLNEQLH
jgi:2,3,4,5-tetrahydropyridine-2-carboxylate N-succinyltransferase